MVFILYFYFPIMCLNAVKILEIGDATDKYKSGLKWNILIVMCAKDTDSTTNSEDPDQTAV